MAFGKPSTRFGKGAKAPQGETIHQSVLGFPSIRRVRAFLQRGYEGKGEIPMEQLTFLTEEQVRRIQREFGAPVYVYDQRTFEQRAREMLAFPNAFGLTVRFAMKALPNAAVIRIFTDMGLHIDASSGFEAERALRAGVKAQRIQLTAQEIPGNLKALVEQGVLYNACSLHQMRIYGQLFPGTPLCVRVNPGLGSGSSNRTNVGGPSSNFGIWHEHLDRVREAAREYRLRITGIHTHIGSGVDPDVWVHCAKLSLGVAARMPEVTSLSLGGGYKVARMAHETTADLQEIGNTLLPEFRAFAQKQGRELHLEVEPGTYLTANAGAIVATVIDVVDTGAGGYHFIKIDSGMTDTQRPAMYGAEQPIIVVARQPEHRRTCRYLVSGHCCESGDTLTPRPGDPEGLEARQLTEARIGDALVIEGSGAYCASQACKNYNSFPESPEVLLTAAGEFRLIRKRQTLEQMIQNEEAP